MKLVKKGFYKLLLRYSRGKFSPEQKTVMDQWFDSIHHEIADKPLGNNEEEIKSRMWARITSSGMEPATGLPVRGRQKWNFNRYFRFAAACVILTAGLFLYNRLFTSTSIIAQVPDSMVRGLVEQINERNTLKVVELSDGSHVTLEPGATLYYPEEFAADERKVFLKGDGFFDITPDRSKPFVVYSDHIVTKVVGTSFTIKKNKQGSIEVAVMTGTVKVRGNSAETAAVSGNREVVLTPNKKVTFYPETEKLITGLVEQPKVIHEEKSAISPELFNYTDAPLPVIVSQLEKAYGVKIDLNDESIRKCTITADISQYNSLYDQLDILCAAISASFEVKGENILLIGTGCISE